MVVVKEMAHDSKVIAMDGTPHLRDGIRQWNGDSRGHWEGDTLVVETTNFSPQSRFGESADKLHLVERYTCWFRYSQLRGHDLGSDDLDTAVVGPHPAETEREDAVFEYACHEGNYGMEGILSGHRAQELAKQTDVQ